MNVGLQGEDYQISFSFGKGLVYHVGHIEDCTEQVDRCFFLFVIYYVLLYFVILHCTVLHLSLVLLKRHKINICPCFVLIFLKTLLNDGFYFTCLENFNVQRKYQNIKGKRDNKFTNTICV